MTLDEKRRKAAKIVFENGGLTAREAIVDLVKGEIYAQTNVDSFLEDGTYYCVIDGKNKILSAHTYCAIHINNYERYLKGDGDEIL